MSGVRVGEYVGLGGKNENLRVERKTLETSRPQPVFARKRTLLCALVDD
jgi:hypothetical protein